MSSTTKEINIPVWYTYGPGWTVSSQGWCKITVTRNYGDTYATVIPYWGYCSPGGAYASVDCYITAGSVSQKSATFGASTHSVGTWYYASGNSFRVPVDDGAGNLSVRIQMHFNDGTSGQDSSTQSASFEYGTRGETTPSLSKSRVNIGENVTITMDPYSSSFSHKLYYSLNNKDLIHIEDFSKGKATKTWTLPASLAEAITTSTEGIIYFVCKTYNGSTQVGGDKSVKLTAVVPDDYVPSISNVTISELTAGLADKFGCFVQNKSGLKVKTECSGVAGSSISSCSVKIQNWTYSGTTISCSLLYDSGPLDIDITVKDSRGRSVSTTRTVQVYPYSSPMLYKGLANRANTSQELDEEGENVLFQFAYAISPVNDKNSASLKIQQYDKSSDSWKTLIEYTDYKKGSYSNTSSGPSIDFAKYMPSVTYDKNESFNFRFVVSDYFATYTKEIEVPVSYTLLEFGMNGHSLAFGGACTNTKDQIDMHMNINFIDGDIYKSGSPYHKRIWDNMYPVGTVILTTSEAAIEMGDYPLYSHAGSWRPIGSSILFGHKIYAFERYK